VVVTAPPDQVPTGWRERWRRVIFEADTPAGRAFDVVLLVVILGSVLLVMFETVPGVGEGNEDLFWTLEWIVTVLFTIEYVARLVTAPSAARYARSFFGVIDLVSALPVYLVLFLPGAQSLLVLRSLRLLRVFRVFKMAQWLSQANYLLDAVRASARKIAVFLLTVVLINVVVGSTMYVIEGAANGFDSMFRGVYWSIVTMSTVGFGDIAPQTTLGQVLAAMLMILGYSVIAVPTGIVSAEMASARHPAAPPATCPACGTAAHAPGATFCHRCGSILATSDPESTSTAGR
jgi:voltage-gated potassium channel